MAKITQKSFLSWIGGKSRLTRKILPLVPEHECYAEGLRWSSLGAV
jgi:site-specific DNA-adenine methylase